MKKEKKKTDKKVKTEIADFFYELDSLRKTARAARQLLLNDDLSDNVASYSFLVAHIGYYLALKEKVDASKVVLMCLFHDVAEARSNDHDWAHKKYIKVFEDEIIADQIASAPHGTFFAPIIKEYEERKTVESRIAKDADLVAYIVVLKEYVHEGNKEALSWLEGGKQSKCDRENFFSESAYELAQALFYSSPGDWWKNIWTNKNR